jgi:malonyl-CoA O-methyltransferase
MKSKFNQDPSYYNEHAMVQCYSAFALCNIYQNEISKAKSILDIGCGTGFLTNNIRSINKKAKIIGVDTSEKMIEFANSNEDKAENVSFLHVDENYVYETKEKFDLVVSNFVFQWMDYLPLYIDVLRHISKNIIFAIPLYGTFKDILAIYDKLNVEPTLSQFYDYDDLKYSGKRMVYTEHYESMKEFLYHIKNIGAGYSEKHLDIKNVKKVLSYKNPVRASYNIGFFIA